MLINAPGSKWAVAMIAERQGKWYPYGALSVVIVIPAGGVAEPGFMSEWEWAVAIAAKFIFFGEMAHDVGSYRR